MSKEEKGCRKQRRLTETQLINRIRSKEDKIQRLLRKREAILDRLKRTDYDIRYLRHLLVLRMEYVHAKELRASEVGNG